jgi:PPP family 3-phenylpropionic acid transporter
MFFFGIGVMYPLLGLHFKEIGLTGTQIGFIMSVGPIVSVLAQPFWGLISDRYQNPRVILTSTSFLAGIIVLGYFISNEYYILVIITALLSLFQSAVIPLADSLTVSYVKRVGGEYGNFRL